MQNHNPRNGASRPRNEGSRPRPQGSAPRRRKLTPAQRRKRWLKKNRNLLIVAGAAIIALVVVLVALPGGSKPADQVVAAPDSIVVAADNTYSDDSGEDPVPMDNDLADPADGSEPDEMYTDDAETDMPASAPVSQPAQPFAPTENFNFETAYTQALNGTVTGPIIVPDYSKVDPNYRSRWQEPAENRMPVLYTAQNVEEKIICITVDDCYQPENLRAIVQCALDNNQKLTIFPIGENMEKLPALREVIKWSWQNGMEIENHTYTHNGLYHFDDDRMRWEIWKQNRMLEQVLGVNYTEHFFRPHGGDERDDQRMQAYINQLGFNAVSMWTMSGSSSSYEACVQKLAPGNVYLFHTVTDKDMNKLLKFIPYCTQQGYKLITLNEMYGLPENETSPLTTTLDDPAPAFRAFKVDPVSLKKVTFCRAAAVVQQRLIDLGWLEGTADGEFGNGSFMATGFFQMASNIKANGVATVETQIAMFSDGAETGSPQRIAQLKKSIGK